MRLGPTDLEAGRLAMEADMWGHRQARVHGGDTYAVRYALAGLLVWASKPSKDGYRVWPQNLGGGPEADGRHVAASKGLYRGEAKDEKARWFSNEEITELDHNVLTARWFAHMYLGIIWVVKIFSPVIRMRGFIFPPLAIFFLPPLSRIFLSLYVLLQEVHR